MLGYPLCFIWFHVGHRVGKLYIAVFGEHQVGLGCFWGRSMVFGEFLSGLGVILFFLWLFLTCFVWVVWVWRPEDVVLYGKVEPLP